jgi:DNA-binding transcriptional LysR family regulator
LEASVFGPSGRFAPCILCVQLSKTAIKLLPYARVLVASSQAALATAISSKRTTVRLGAVEFASSFLLPAPLGSFRRRRPDVDVSIVVGLCADLKTRVEMGELDIALTGGKRRIG